MNSKILPLEFYTQGSVVTIAKKLLGKVLFSKNKGIVTGGIICETEAYGGITDKACHAYGGRYTKRTETMYLQGGVAYVYLCYGMHHMLNVVTNIEGSPEAVLIRALHPLRGISPMQKRRNGRKNLTDGPGTLCQALAITKQENGLSLKSKSLWIEYRDYKIPTKDILTSPRIGIDFAKEDALKPWHFRIKRQIITSLLS